MAIADTDKVDFLWKSDIFGVAKTASGATKAGSNETIPTALPVMPSNIWKDGDSIPATPPTTTSAIVKVYSVATSNVIQLTNDTTSPANQTWLACSTLNNAATRMVDFISPTKGSGYIVRVWIGNPSVGPAARIFQDTTGEEFIYNYASGVLTFINTIPSGKPATVGSGNVSVSTHNVYVEVYQYIGTKGASATLATLSDVQITTPIENQILRYEGSKWVNTDFPFIPLYLNDLIDVEDSTGTPTDGYVLTWEGGVWQPKAPPASVDPASLGTMSTQNADDVNITGGIIANVTFENVTIDGGTF